MGAMPDELTLPGMITVEHTFEVPLDHARPDGERISVFARELADPEGRKRPYLVYLQGGPGFEATRPSTGPRGPGWIDRALSEFRVLLLDQRGTGRSTPVGDLAGMSPSEQADHLALFRADSIVRDAELIRQELGIERWSVLGQTFGGMCVTTYLSIAPGGLREAFLTGGLPALERPIDEIYTETYGLVLERNRRYLERYPADGARLEAIKRRADEGRLQAAGGERLTWRRFRQLGASLGMSDGADHIHHLLELPLDSPAFRHDLAASNQFSRNPLYAVLHEACWCDGGRSEWAAERLLPAAYADSTLLTGEHVYPWMFEDYAELAPLRQVAELLAGRDWPRLYAPEVLASNEVPVAAIIYADDMYVPRVFSEETARRIRGAKYWLTNEYEHNGLRADGPRILDRLLELARGRR
jgi:pimeloyl-ACP methyl ester carboxylesterase